MASPDALVRLQKSHLAGSQQELCQIYFFQQHHDSLLQFLEYHLQNTVPERRDGLLMQVKLSVLKKLIVFKGKSVLKCFNQPGNRL